MPRRKNNTQNLLEGEISMQNENQNVQDIILQNAIVNDGANVENTREVLAIAYLKDDTIEDLISRGIVVWGKLENEQEVLLFKEDAKMYIDNGRKVYVPKSIFNMLENSGDIELCEDDNEYHYTDEVRTYFGNGEDHHISVDEFNDMISRGDLRYCEDDEKYIDADEVRTYYDYDGNSHYCSEECFERLQDDGEIQCCEDCGEYYTSDSLYSINDGQYYVCPDCIDDYYKCEHCEEYYDSDHIVEAYDEYGDTVYYCNHCAEDHTWVCDDCGTTYDDSVESREDYDGNYVCPDCIEDHYAVCADCEALYNTRDYDECPDCGCGETEADVAEQRREERRQEELRQADNFATNRIYSYGEEHRLPFHLIKNQQVVNLNDCTKEDLIATGGIELEISRSNCDSNRQETVNKIDNILNANFRQFRFAEDGSLGCYGFELISEIFTREDFDKLPLEELCETLKARGYLSNDWRGNGNQCGLHYHISRQTFGETEKEQQKTIAKIVYFLSNYWGEMVKVSRRCGTNHYARQPFNKFNFETFKEFINEVNYSIVYRQLGHTCAINLEHDKTVEFRFFRGTLNANFLRMSKKFLDCLVDFAKVCRWTDLYENKVQVFFDNLPADVIDYIKYRKAFPLYVKPSEVAMQLAEV